MSVAKTEVHDFWDRASCGEELYLQSFNKEGFEKQARIRYELEPYIMKFADFDKFENKKILEIGVGLGADHQKFVEVGANTYGIDLTARAIEITKKRLSCYDLSSNLKIGDAENLEFSDNSFDFIYSWGVIHHSPDTQKAVDEIYRVLKPGGTAKIMIYHKWSVVGLMLWCRYGLLGFRPLESLDSIYSNYLESPGTKAYSKKDAQELLACFKKVQIDTVLTHGDLLTSGAGQRHKGFLLDLARIIWPRWLIKSVIPHAGLFMLIEAVK